jgi:multidrug efflux pump subunit AcrB
MKGLRGRRGIGRHARFQNGTRNFYGGSLRWVLAHRPVMLLMSLAVLGTTGYLYVAVQKGFIPDRDNDRFNSQLQAQQGIPYYQMMFVSTSAQKASTASFKHHVNRSLKNPSD